MSFPVPWFPTWRSHTHIPSIDCPAPELWTTKECGQHITIEGHSETETTMGAAWKVKSKGPETISKNIKNHWQLPYCWYFNHTIWRRQSLLFKQVQVEKLCPAVVSSFSMFFLHGFWTQCVEKSGNIWRFCLWGSLCWSEYIRLPNISYHIHLGLRRFKIRSIKSGSFFG